MGQLNRHNIARLAQQYGLEEFVETGTWKGDGLLCALRTYCFNRLWSVELQPELWQSATERVQSEWPDDPRWTILLGESGDGISHILDELQGPVLWWLDAHLPERYGLSGGAPRLPLESELLRILYHMDRDASKDVFIIDDWRLYEPLKFDNGPFKGTPEQPQRVMGPIGDATKLLSALNARHRVNRDLRDEGYLVAVPR